VAGGFSVLELREDVSMNGFFSLFSITSMLPAEGQWEG
jgi:hypothetical protein